MSENVFFALVHVIWLYLVQTVPNPSGVVLRCPIVRLSVPMRNLYGAYDTEHNSVVIYADNPYTAKRTLLHELSHAILYQLGLEYKDKSIGFESFVRKVTHDTGQMWYKTGFVF